MDSSDEERDCFKKFGRGSLEDVNLEMKKFSLFCDYAQTATQLSGLTKKESLQKVRFSALGPESKNFISQKILLTHKDRKASEKIDS